MSLRASSLNSICILNVEERTISVILNNDNKDENEDKKKEKKEEVKEASEKKF